MCVNGLERETLAHRRQGKRMKALRHIAALTLLGLVPGLALAASARPLRLELPNALPASADSTSVPATRPTAFARSMAPRPARAEPLFQRNGVRANANRDANLTRAQDLGRQALQNVVDPAYVNLDEDRAEGKLQLKFNKRGNAFKDLNKSYLKMCDRVSQKIWDDPNGKRIRFDAAGRPGVSIEIPVGHH